MNAPSGNTDNGRHVERPARLANGQTYCACGAPWPCAHATCPRCGALTPAEHPTVYEVGGRIVPCPDRFHAPPSGNTDNGWKALADQYARERDAAVDRLADARADLADARERIETLLLISNVNGDWNIKYANVVADLAAARTPPIGELELHENGLPLTMMQPVTFDDSPDARLDERHEIEVDDALAQALTLRIERDEAKAQCRRLNRRIEAVREVCAEITTGPDGDVLVGVLARILRAVDAVPDSKEAGE